MSDPASNTALIQEAFDNAVSHYQAGRFEEAEELYRAILQIEPQHPNANYNLGLLAVQFKQTAAALHFLKTALLAAPDEEPFWLSYLEALSSLGERDAAVQALQLSQKHGLRLQGEIVDRIIQQSPLPLAQIAPVKPQHVSQPSPDDIKASSRAFERGDFITLERLGKTLIEAHPYATAGWKALGLAYFHTGRAAMALAPTLKLVELQPDDAQAHANLGLIFMTLRQLPEAEKSLLHAIALDPRAADAHTNLGNVRREQGQLDQAANCYRRTLNIDPKHSTAHANLGVVLLEQGDFRNSEVSLRTALTLEPGNTTTLGGLSTVLTKLGLLEEAEVILRKSLKLNPENIFSYDLLLFLLNYTHTDKSREARELAVNYGKLARRKSGDRYTQWVCDPSPQRLKVGIVSGDLNQHPVGYFTETLLRNVDPARLEIIAYSSMPERKNDEQTLKLHAYFSAWKPIHRLSYQQAAELIHADGIHILLDLSGHTTDNRLPVFSMKPAPIQASWLGYFATTGVAEMDYLIGDPYLCPTDEEGDFTEAVWRLPKTWLCLTPPQEEQAVAELPALRNGYVTFGCFNNLNKLNDAVVALWAEILQRIPDAKLFLKSPQLRDPEVQTETQKRFAKCGITKDRLILEGPSPRTEYLESYGRVDIALDPFPYPGGATSVDTLWMGVPILTLHGNRFLAHLGESIAHNAGMPEWVARDKTDYISKAIAFAGDLPTLARFRAGLRARMLASPLLDAAGFGRDFEEALWRMWEKGPRPPSDALDTQPPKSPKAKQPSVSDLAKLKQLTQQKRYAELEKLGVAVTHKYPHALAGWQALSFAQYNGGRFEQALQSTHKLLELQPDNGPANNTLGLIYLSLKRLPEAEIHLCLAKEQDSTLVDPYINLGYIRRQQGRLDDAAACYARATELAPSMSNAHSNLGAILLEQQKLRPAENSFRKALALQANNLTALLGLGSVLVKLGLLHEAEAVARRTLALDPGNAQAYSTLLFLLNYGNTENSREALELAQRFGAAMTKKTKHHYTHWNCDAAPVKLRVGIVSGDLYKHPVGYFLEGLLSNLDTNRVEVIAYANRPARRNDAMSERLQSYCAAWKTIDELDDAAAAALIHADGIHILLDLAGHTGNNRLPVFAAKPAPVQAAWLGYFATTGVAEIDYLIGDPNVCPPKEEAHFTEAIWRLPETYLCFTPPDVEVPVNKLPALENGYITFGCFNNIGKLTDTVIAVWSRILQQLPDARLMLKARQLGDAAVCSWIRDRFAAHGIGADRLLLEGPTPRMDYLQAYQRVDIVLDPFPYPGGTTTVEALWMSIPVLTLRGSRMLSHAGENIMRNVGLPEWIADDEEDYVAKAVGFAADLDALAALRGRLRQQALASPMFDAPRFAHNFKEALWGLWNTLQTRMT